MIVGSSNGLLYGPSVGNYAVRCEKQYRSEICIRLPFAHFACCKIVNVN